MAEDFVSVSHLTKRFGDLTVLSDISFSVRKGEFLCVVGPTGCGKTTFLSCLTGAYGVNSGSILLDGEKVDLKKRNIAYIMQEYSTLPWLTVRQNVAFGLTIKKRPRKETDPSRGINAKIQKGDIIWDCLTKNTAIYAARR